MYVKIVDSTLNRDMRSRGLVETDVRKAQEYKEKAAMMNKARTVQEEINTLKNDISEIKEMLKALIK